MMTHPNDEEARNRLNRIEAELSEYRTLSTEELSDFIESNYHDSVDNIESEILYLKHLHLLLSLVKEYCGEDESLTLEFFENNKRVLRRAIERYDQTKSYDLETYATWWIRQSIVNHLAKIGSTELFSKSTEIIEEYQDNEPAPNVTSDLLNEDLKRVMSDLNQFEQKVLILRFGLQSGTTRTLEEVGQLLSMSRDEIRRIEVSALKKIRRK